MAAIARRREEGGGLLTGSDWTPLIVLSAFSLTPLLDNILSPPNDLLQVTLDYKVATGRQQHTYWRFRGFSRDDGIRQHPDVT